MCVDTIQNSHASNVSQIEPDRHTKSALHRTDYNIHLLIWTHIVC